MFMPLSFWCWTTQSMAASTCETSVSPSASATFTLTICALGAMPRKCVVSLELTDVSSLSRPAMIPAMCVP